MYKKDVGDGKVFWSAVTADRIILPNGAQYEQFAYKPTSWYLFIADDEYELKDCSIEISENSDSVSHPLHYASGWSNGAEVIDLTEHLSFCAGNVVKYVCRAGRKNPDKYVEDLEKARWYLDREIARVEEL